MSFKEAIRNLGEKIKAKKAFKERVEDQARIQELIEERKKSANQRELERFMKEEREEQIKETLDFYRKKREQDIAFGHNPLDVPNITAQTDWNVLKEKNIFVNNGNMFNGEASVLKNNPNLLKNSLRLLGGVNKK